MKIEEQSNVLEDKDCWRCKDCGAEWSFAMGDNEVPETCPYCIDDATKQDTESQPTQTE